MKLTLEEIEAMHKSMMAQPRLSDEPKGPVRWIWVYGKDIATIKEIPCAENPL